MDPLITADNALERHEDGRTRFIDATWTFPSGPAPAAAGVVPGAVHFDIDVVRDEASTLPHMLPSPADFERHASALGLSDTTPLIVYDRMGLFSAPRVWWMFLVMGHQHVQVLNGGLPAWIDAGGRIVENHAKPEPDLYRARFQPDRVINKAGVEANLNRPGSQIVDMRSAPRFKGEATEPRPGMRSGHMPGALNLHYSSMLRDGKLAYNRADLENTGIDFDKAIIASCGSGVTACILALALYREGKEAAVYDGSWAEWGSQEDTPIEKA